MTFEDLAQQIAWITGQSLIQSARLVTGQLMILTTADVALSDQVIPMDLAELLITITRDSMAANLHLFHIQ